MSSTDTNRWTWLNDWIVVQREPIGKNELLLYSEKRVAVDTILEALRLLITGHYLDPKITESRVAAWGGLKAMKLLRECYPTTKTAQSGDLGEILATEIAERDLGYRVPIRRLRYKDGRNMPLRGDDIVGVADSDDALAFLKGESKSRGQLTSTVVTEAVEALEKNAGQPTRHSVLFVAARLSEQGEEGLALQLINAVMNSFASNRIEHFLFVLCGNNPEHLIRDYLCSKSPGSPVCHAVGIRVKQHSSLVSSVYAE